jgi:hypothetical protein
MPEHPRTGPWILIAAIVLGALGDALFRPGADGLNVGLWLAAAAGAAWAVVRGLRLAAPRGRLVLAAPALLFALLIAFRDSPTLRLLDFLAIGVALSLPMWRPAAGVAWRATPGEAAAGIVLCAREAAGGAYRLVAADVPWSIMRGSGTGRRAFAVVRGLAVASAPLLVFGTLFMMADAGFEASVNGLLAVDPEDVLSHVWLVGLYGWLAAGLFRGALADRQAAPPVGPEQPPEKWRLGTIELVIVLGLVDLLFAAFVAHQLPWLFGGHRVVLTTEDLTMADYARRGFFELGLVTGLALPMLFAMRWLVGASLTRLQERLYTALAGTLLVLLGVIIVSAGHRMALYQTIFGLTELRVFVLAFEAWMAGLLAWFAATVLRRRPERFAAGAVAWGFAGIVALHVPNLEAAIVRSNVAHATPKMPLDVGYLATLSADAVPALAAALPAIDPERRRVVKDRLAAEAAREIDWRNWNVSRHVAREAATLLPAPLAASLPR